MGEGNRDRKGNIEMGKGYSPPKYLYCVYFSLQYYMVDEQSAVYKDQTSFTNLVWPRQISEALDQSQGVQKKKKKVTLVPEQRFWLKKKTADYSVSVPGKRHRVANLYFPKLPPDGSLRHPTTPSVMLLPSPLNNRHSLHLRISYAMPVNKYDKIGWVMPRFSRQRLWEPPSSGSSGSGCLATSISCSGSFLADNIIWTQCDFSSSAPQW